MKHPSSTPGTPRDSDKALSVAWVGVLAQGMQEQTDETLRPEAAASIKARIMQKIAADIAKKYQAQPSIESVYRDDGWVSLCKTMQAKVLHDDGITLSWLLKLLPGGRLPHHDHADGAEECMVLEGQLDINGQSFIGGDYQIAHPSSIHYEVSSKDGALVFLKSPAARRKSLFPA